MSSDLFVFDNFFSDPFSPFTDSSIDIFQEFQENSNNSTNLVQEKDPLDETNSLEKISSALFSSSSSPPSFQLENLSISHFGNEKYPFSEVKSEEFPVPFESFTCYNNSFMPQSYDGGSDIAMKFMQRSFSSKSFDGKPNNLFQPGFDCVLECSDLQKQILNSPESSFSSGELRRVYSTGDLQKMRTNLKTGNALSSSPLSTEKSFMEEANFKVGRYSAQERKERIHRYRAKRTQRNFNKTIKYACRKTLADNRPRVRGRFARNDEAGEIPKTSMFNRYEEEDDLWIDGFHEEEDEGIIGGGPFFNNFGSTQYQNYDYR
ncbi:CCT motif family protein [Forsythia ovata]|uniref:CCT motif family protein n=1 Tax=Forsythia ovata TaxID=205694 RepID=A0ABD1WD08_9LAMI